MELALRLHDATIRQVLAKHSGYEARLVRVSVNPCVCYVLRMPPFLLPLKVTTEGDAFQIAFHDTCDAVAFCLDTQARVS